MNNLLSFLRAQIERKVYREAACDRERLTVTASNTQESIKHQISYNIKASKSVLLLSSLLGARV
jgi:hypothetical protein